MGALIQSWDVAILSWFRTNHDPLAIWSAWVVATLAWKGLLFWSLAALLWLRGQRMLALQIALALLVGIVEIGSLKGIVLRPRPDLYTSQTLHIPMPELLSTTHSFPSGHTTLAAAGAFVLAASCGAASLPAVLSYVFVALVGIVRVFQGMHWPSDIVGSIVLGALAGIIGMVASKIKLLQILTGVSQSVKDNAISKRSAEKEKTKV